MTNLVQVTLLNTSNGATFNVSPEQVKHYTRMSNIEIVKTPKAKVEKETKVATPKKTEKKVEKKVEDSIKETIIESPLVLEGEKATVETEIQVTK